MHKLLLVLTLILIAQHSLEMAGYSIIQTPSIEVNPGEVLMIRITQSGWIMVEIAHDGKIVLDNTATGGYRDVNVTFDNPGNYIIIMRNTHYSKERIMYSIAVTGKDHSREIVLS